MPWPWPVTERASRVVALGSRVGHGIAVAAVGAADLVVLTLLCLAAGLVMSSTELARNVWFFTMVALLETVVICFGINVCLTGGLHLPGAARDPLTIRSPAARCRSRRGRARRA